MPEDDLKNLRVAVVGGGPGGYAAAFHAADLGMTVTLIDADVTRISLADYPLPLYQGDLEAKAGPPANALRLKQMIMAHHGLVVPLEQLRINCGVSRDGGSCETRSS